MCGKEVFSGENRLHETSVFHEAYLSMSKNKKDRMPVLFITVLQQLLFPQGHPLAACLLQYMNGPGSRR